MLHDVEPPTLGVPSGAECLETNIVFVNRSQDFIFHLSLSFVFPPMFALHFAALKYGSWRPLRVVETLGGRFLFNLLSVVVAEIVMQDIEEQTLATYTRNVPLWLGYVDDAFTAVHKDGIDDFHEYLNRRNADIHFTKEMPCHSRQQQTKNDFLQKTDTYRPITRPVFVQTDLSQGYYYPDSDKTSVTSLRLT